MSLQVAKLIKNRHTIKNKSRNSNTLTLKSQLFAPITSISPRNFTSFSSKILMAQIDNLRYDDDLNFFRFEETTVCNRTQSIFSCSLFRLFLAQWWKNA